MTLKPSQISTLIEVKQNDTARIIYDTLQLSGYAIDLTNTTISLNMYNTATETNTSYPATASVPTSGSVYLQFPAAELTTTGSRYAEWQVIFADGSELTIPTNQYIKINIIDDLD